MINENSFDGAPGGIGGTTNGQVSLGTHSSPQSPQIQSHSTGGTATVSTQLTNDSGSFNRDVNVLFSKKEKPTVDDVLVGIDYEMMKMQHKDKVLAKKIVVANLKKHGPKYYTKLNMLGIDDTADTAGSDPIIAERVKLLNQMVQDKKNKRIPMVNQPLVDLLNNMSSDKSSRVNQLFRKSI
jgi:hypothetical protein